MSDRPPRSGFGPIRRLTVLGSVLVLVPPTLAASPAFAQLPPGGGPVVNYPTALANPLAAGDTKAPELELSGPLSGAQGESLLNTTYTLHVDARDGALTSATERQSGMARIEVRLDGALLTTRLAGIDPYAPLACAPLVFCQLALDWTLNTAPLAVGEHALEVSAIDNAANRTTTTIGFGYDAEPADLLACTAATAPTNFATYSLGPQFENLAVSSISRSCEPPWPGEPVRSNLLSYTYGTCTLAPDPAADPLGATCAPPLEIQTWPVCERSLADYRLEPEVPYPNTPLGPIRAATAYSFDDGQRIELYSGASTIVLFGDDPARLLRATAAISPEPTNLPPGPPHPGGAANLPTASAGATTGTLGCA